MTIIVEITIKKSVFFYHTNKITKYFALAALITTGCNNSDNNYTATVPKDLQATSTTKQNPLILPQSFELGGFTFKKSNNHNTITAEGYYIDNAEVYEIADSTNKLIGIMRAIKGSEGVENVILTGLLGPTSSNKLLKTLNIAEHSEFPFEVDKKILTDYFKTN